MKIFPKSTPPLTNSVSFDFTKAETFTVGTGVQMIQNNGGQTFVFQKSEKIAVVMSRGFESYFHFA